MSNILVSSNDLTPVLLRPALYDPISLKSLKKAGFLVNEPDVSAKAFYADQKD